MARYKTNRDLGWLPYLIVVLLFGLCLFLYTKSNNKDNKVITPIDTTYSRVIIDSVKIKINNQDTIIYNLKVKLNDSIEKTYSLNDSATIAKFKELLSK